MVTTFLSGMHYTMRLFSFWELHLNCYIYFDFMKTLFHNNHDKFIYSLVMSSSQAGSSQSSSWRIFSSARLVTFYLLLENWKTAETSRNFNVSQIRFFFDFFFFPHAFSEELVLWSVYIWFLYEKKSFFLPWNDWVFLVWNQEKKSFEQKKLYIDSSAQLGKFQLEIITTIYVLN